MKSTHDHTADAYLDSYIEAARQQFDGAEIERAATRSADVRMSPLKAPDVYSTDRPQTRIRI